MTAAVWQFRCRGNWDHAMLMHAFDGSLYRAFRAPFTEFQSDVLRDAGCILVIPGGHCASVGWTEQAAEFIRTKPWVLAIVVSDEASVYDCAHLSAANSRVWVQTPTPDKHADVNRVFPIGLRGGLRRVGQELARPEWAKNHLWGFVGHARPPRRDDCVALLQGMRGSWQGRCHVTGGFAEGLGYEEYLRAIQEVGLVPCPTGFETADTFRLWESLEMGTLPVGDTRTAKKTYPGGYYPYATGGAVPFPCVDDWSEFPTLVQDYAQDEAKLLRDTNHAVAWWVQQKRQFLRHLEEDVSALSGQQIGLPASTIMLDCRALSFERIEAAVAAAGSAHPHSELFLLLADGDFEHDKTLRKVIWFCNWCWSGCLPFIVDDDTFVLDGFARTPLVLP